MDKYLYILYVQVISTEFYFFMVTGPACYGYLLFGYFYAETISRYGGLHYVGF